MSFQNLYYQRVVATPRPCAVCLRPTTIVLSTMGNVDFIYTCERHLTDPGFASKLPDAGASPVPTTPKPPVDEELVKKVAEEWEEKQRRKKEKEEKDKKDKEVDKKDEKDKRKDKKESAPKSPPLPVTPSAPATPTHNRYVLHRSLFASRQLEHRKRRQLKEAREIAPRLPGVP
ncbi:DUF1742-domain-containing protein, partial [Calocera cornea HHB12733]